jgi:glycosyltransferase involved in cell wall biosynthesis
MIKVAYDLSFVSQHYRRLNFEKFGIYQVAHQVLEEILAKDDQTIELGVTSLCSDKIYDAFVGHALLLYDALKAQKNIKFESCFQSKIGKISDYYWLYDRLYADLFRKRSNLLSHLLRAGRKIILSILESYQKWNLSYDFRIGNYDLFHSVYLGLPDPEFTGKMKRVLTIHDLIPLVRPDLVSPNLAQEFRQKILNTIVRNRDFIICVSHHTKQQVCDYLHIDLAQVFVTHLGASSAFYHLDDQDKFFRSFHLSHLTKKTYFLGTASLESRKNTQFLIRCFCDLIQSYPDLEINLVLVGSLQPAQEALVHNINQHTLGQTKSQIICAGYASDADLNLLYNHARAFIFPSLYEGFGLPVLEALQCGTPVICSRTTALPEVAGEAALFIDPQDSDTLKQAMLQIITDDQLRSSLSHKAMDRAKQFSWKKCADRTIEAYQSIVEWD